MIRTGTLGFMVPKCIFAALVAMATVATAVPSRAEPVLKVGTNSKGTPWSFHDAGTNAERGIAVDLITAIAKDVGFQVEFVPMALAELIPSLNAHKTDIIAANLLITPERQALVDFSSAIAPGGDGLIVLKSDGQAYKTLEDLKGTAAGSQAGSPFAATLQKSGLFPDLKIYPTGADAMRAVTAGEIKAAVVGANIAAYEIKLGHFPDLQLVKSYQPLVNSVDAFSVRKGDGELLRKINISLAKLHADGTVKKILGEYGL